MNLLSFTEYLKMKQNDLHGSDIKLSEKAAIRKIIETIAEYERFVRVQNKQVLDSILDQLKGIINEKRTNRDQHNKKIKEEYGNNNEFSSISEQK